VGTLETVNPKSCLLAAIMIVVIFSIFFRLLVQLDVGDGGMNEFENPPIDRVLIEPPAASGLS